MPPTAASYLGWAHAHASMGHQTSAHDALNGYVPNGMTLAEALRRMRTTICVGRWRRWPRRRAMLALKRRGAVTFDYGNNIRAQAEQAGVGDAFDIPGFVPEYVRPLFCEAKGHFDGRPSASRKIFASPISSRFRCLLETTRCAGGCGWRRSASRSRDCRRGFSGRCHPRSGRHSVSRSTIWCAAGS